MAEFSGLTNLESSGDRGIMGFNSKKSKWVARVAGAGVVLGISIFAVGRTAAQEPAAQEQAPPPPWIAPDDAKKVKNPVPSSQENLAAGEQLFSENCVLCHGEKGLGDGPGAKTIKVKPANFTDSKLQASETDGALFWKMSNGRGPMPAWKDVLTDEERWKLVDYIRKLGKDAAKK
jgi:mono/diheme cytochrome c family protein